MRLSPRVFRSSIVAPLITILPLFIATRRAVAYDKATEGNEVVMNKLFPKKNRVELDAKAGIVLNSSYEQTFLANAGITYFWSEEWGFNIEGDFASVKDKNERRCIESFYNNPNYDLPAECGEDPPVDDKPVPTGGVKANWGPAYVPIRKLKYMFSGNFIWNPIYGKQIVMLSATNYFDFYLGMGGGIAMSDFWPKQTVFPSTGVRQRAPFCTKENNSDAQCTDPNPGTDDPNLIGEAGRPQVQSQNNPLIHLSVGQRFHFMKRFLVSASLENYTLLGTESGFDNFLTIMGGFGVRF